MTAMLLVEIWRNLVVWFAALIGAMLTWMVITTWWTVGCIEESLRELRSEALEAKNWREKLT